MDIDILKAIDDAIGDGVDVLSISIGFNMPLSYGDDVIAKGALHAVIKNIVVVCSAGNYGPSPKSLSNPAPWIITVGASTVDRSFLAPIKLRNGTTIEVILLHFYLKRKLRREIAYKRIQLLGISKWKLLLDGN